MSKSIVEEADSLLENHEYEKAFKLLLPHKNEENDEILWRLAMSMHDLAYFNPNPNSDSAKRMNEEALNLTTKALQINEKNPEVHKMMAAVLDAHYKNVSIKARVEQSLNIKKHIMRAAELNPKDPHTWYSLGQWHYNIADLSWAVKKITQVIFSTPLEATFDEALGYFQKLLEQEEAKSYKNYCMGLLMAAQCCIKLNKKSEAVQYLKQICELPDHTPIEKNAHEEAKKLLEELSN